MVIQHLACVESGRSKRTPASRAIKEVVVELIVGEVVIQVNIPQPDHLVTGIGAGACKKTINSLSQSVSRVCVHAGGGGCRNLTARGAEVHHVTAGVGI